MKHALLSFLFLFVLSMSSSAQFTYDTVNVHDIQFVDQSDLINCNDSSAYLGDTVTVVGYALTHGNRSELASGSSPTGHRPVLNITDTTDNGIGGHFRGLQVHGYFDGVASTVLDNIEPGMLIYVTGIVDAFNNETQIYPLDNSSVVVPGPAIAPPQAISVPVSDLNDQSGNNKPETGERWEGSYVELTGLTIIEDLSYSNRRQYLAQDDQGYRVHLFDKFLAMKDGGWQTVNPNSPETNGTLNPFPVGTRLDTVRGIIDHSSNGCFGGGQFDRGYRISPVYESDLVEGETPPIISNVDRDITFPGTSDAVEVTADIVDVDGTVQSATLFFTTDLTAASPAFTSVTMNNTTADEYAAEIPAQSEGTRVGYYIEAVDNDNNSVTFPVTGAGQNQNTIIYTVRDGQAKIQDIQFVPHPNQNDASPYEGLQVTVTGVVTSSWKAYDLGYTHIQDPDDDEFAGIMLVNNIELGDLQRHQIVTVTGTVREEREFTQLEVSSINEIDSTRFDTVAPVQVDPGDSTSQANRGWEKYEGMLVEYINSTPGDSLYVTEARRDPFGAWTVSSEQGAPRSRSSWVMTGIQAQQNWSSVYVSVITDDTNQLFNSNAPMMVDVVPTSTDQSMISIRGILTARFDQFKLTPRNNDDIIGFSEPLDSAQLEPSTLPEAGGENSVTELTGNNTVSVYPNPAQNFVNVRVLVRTENTRAQLYDVNGRVVLEQTLNNDVNRLNTDNLSSGFYILRVVDGREVLANEKVIIR